MKKILKEEHQKMKQLFKKVSGKYQVTKSDITSEVAHKKFPHWKKINEIFPEDKEGIV